MRIGILSDTHDRVERTERAVARLRAEGAEALIHCGDLTGPEVVHACAGLPGYYVLGNNDFDVDALRTAIETVGGVFLGDGGEVVLAGRRFGVTHGHLAREFRRLVAAQPDYLLFGHTHLRLDERDGPTRQINPGALHRAAEWTVALLETNTDAVRFVLVR